MSYCDKGKCNRYATRLNLIIQVTSRFWSFVKNKNFYDISDELKFFYIFVHIRTLTREVNTMIKMIKHTQDQEMMDHDNILFEYWNHLNCSI